MHYCMTASIVHNLFCQSLHVSERVSSQQLLSDLGEWLEPIYIISSFFLEVSSKLGASSN